MFMVVYDCLIWGSFSFNHFSSFSNASKTKFIIEKQHYKQIALATVYTISFKGNMAIAPGIVVSERILVTSILIICLHYICTLRYYCKLKYVQIWYTCCSQ